MSDRDLTPDEARAEVEAFMGEGWTVQVYCHWPDDTPSKIRTVRCEQVHADGIELKFSYSTYRAAVDALLQAWRDAVRPWVIQADSGGFKAGMKAQQYVAGGYGVKEGDLEMDAHRVARVLKEDSHG